MSEDPAIVRKLMIATVMDADFLRGLRDLWHPELVGSAWLWLASTRFEYLDKYGEAPRLNIEPIWESENRLDPDAKAELGRLLSGLSKQCEKDERLNSKYLLEQARRHFQRGLFLRKVLEIEAAAEAGELERANEVLRELNEGNEKIAAASAGPLKGTTARELLQMEIMEPEWVVQGIIPTGLTLLAGRPKSGKSYFMINLVAQLAAGGKVFNEKLQEFAAKHNIGVIAVHHTKKSKEQEVFDEISGSTGLTGSSDSNMVFRKVPGDKDIRFIHYQGRETGDGILEFAFENHRFRLDKVPETEGFTKRISRISPQREVILYVLETQYCEMSRADLIAAVGRNVGSGIDTVLENMVSSGDIEKPRRGFYMHPDHWLRLRASELGMEAERKVLEMRRCA